MGLVPIQAPDYHHLPNAGQFPQEFLTLKEARKLTLSRTQLRGAYGSIQLMTIVVALVLSRSDTSSGLELSAFRLDSLRRCLDALLTRSCFSAIRVT